MKIQIVGIEQTDKWNSIVESFADFDVYYLNGYVKGFEIHGDGEPALIYMEDDGFKAMNVIMKRSLSVVENLRGCKAAENSYDASTPYGYGGFLIEGTLTDEIIEEYENFCKENNIVAEFVRFNPMTDNQNNCQSLYDVYKLGETVYIDLQDEEYVWNNFSGKNRNVIRKAVKEGVTIHSTDEPWIVDEFMEIYNDTMTRDEATDYYYFKKEYYDSIVEGLKDNFRFFYAKKDDRIIAVSIILEANNRLHYHLSASRREFQKFAPTNLLLWEVCKYGVEKGCNSLHLGGGVGSKEDGLYKFKKSFNKNENKQYCIGKKIYDADKYEELVNFRGEIADSGFFPKYRG